MSKIMINFTPKAIQSYVSISPFLSLHNFTLMQKKFFFVSKDKIAIYAALTLLMTYPSMYTNIFYKGKLYMAIIYIYSKFNIIIRLLLFNSNSFMTLIF